MKRIITEIGLNHLGSTELAEKYLKDLLKKNIYGITFQLRENNFYKKFPKLKLPFNFYTQVSKLCRKNNIKFGIAICSMEHNRLLKSLNVDFIKVINRGLINKKLIKYLFESNVKKIYISLGNCTKSEIDKNYSYIEDKYKKKLIYVYTKNNSKNYVGDKSNSSKIKEINLKEISLLKKQYKVPIAFGHHFDDKKVIINSLIYNPYSLLFYIKGNQLYNYPDNKHAVQMKNLNNLISKILYEKK